MDVKKFIVIGGYRGEDDEFEDGYHHIPTGNIQEAVHIGPKTVDLKYMSCTQSVKIDDVIEVQEDCDYDITIHTKESEYATVTHIEKEKPIEYKRITEVVIGPPSRLIKLLEDQGYELKPGGWGKKDKFFFNFDMINFSGKAPATEYFWEDDWIEEKHTSQSIIDEIMTIKKQFIGDDYYSEDDRKTIYGWSDEDAKKVLRDMVYTLTKSRSKDDLLLSGFCPFCRFHERSCSECSYAENHGKCNQSDSDYKRLMKNLGNKMETGSIILNVIFSNPITKNLGDK